MSLDIPAIHQEVSLESLCPDLPMERYKMNLLCASPLHDRLYLALGPKVVQLDLLSDGCIREHRPCRVVSVESDINQLVLRTDPGGSREVVVAYTQEGFCHIIQDMVLLQSIDNRMPTPDSCWSGDIHLGHHHQDIMLVLGSNNMHINKLFLDQDMNIKSRSTIKQHDNNIPAVSICPSGKYFITGGIDYIICLFNRNMDVPLMTMPVEEWVWGFCWPSHGDYLLVGLQSQLLLFSFQEQSQPNVEQVDSLVLPRPPIDQQSLLPPQWRRRFAIRMHAYHDLQRYCIMHHDHDQRATYVTYQYSPFAGLVTIQDHRLQCHLVLDYNHRQFAALASAQKRIDQDRTVWYQVYEENTTIRAWLLGHEEYSLDHTTIF